MINEVVKSFKKNYNKIMQGCFESDLFSKTNPDSLCSKLGNLYGKNRKNNLRERIYRNDKNLLLELGAYSLLRTLLKISTEAAYEIFRGRDLSYKTKVIKKFVRQDIKNQFNGKGLHEIIMLFLDYVTGMTDGYATYVNKRLLGLGS